MTSSFIIKKLREEPMKDLYTYKMVGLPNSPLGGLEDSYLKLQGNCHPDFTAVPIGNPHGAKMCVRNPDVCGRRLGETEFLKSQDTIENSQGYWRGSVDMYDVKKETPYQQINPYYYSDRRTPWESDLIRRDYIRLPIKYNGTGINPVRIPHQLKDADKPYISTGLAYTPVDDPYTGLRTATRWDQSVPPPKWNVNQLHQAYDTWQRESEYVRHPRHDDDTKHMEKIV